MNTRNLKRAGQILIYFLLMPLWGFGLFVMGIFASMLLTEFGMPAFLGPLR